MVAWTVEVAASLSQPLLPPYRILNGSRLAPAPPSPAVVQRKHSHSCLGNPKAEMPGCRWPERDSAPGYHPCLAAQTPVNLAEGPH